ncbi:MAG: methyltransferase, partial [Clostridia bacterium]|nr:methyltransferase [Clostridia bacterium]
MERTDDLILAGWKILQQENGFRFGTDSVLLYNLLPCPCGDTVDLCSGNGAIALMALAGGKAEKVTAVELQPEGCRLAEKSAALNDASHRLQVICGDLRRIESFLPPQSQDTVCANPPYFKKGSGMMPPDKALAVCRYEISCTVEDVFTAASYLLREGGNFYMVHRAERRREICEKIKKFDLQISQLHRVFSYPNQESKL